MRSLLTESLLTLHDAAKLLPSNRAGKPLNFSTVFRWVLRGVRGPSGQRVRLEGMRIGGRWLTSREALDRFADALTPNYDENSKELIRSPAVRQKENDDAAKKLKKMGL